MRGLAEGRTPPAVFVRMSEEVRRRLESAVSVVARRAPLLPRVPRASGEQFPIRVLRCRRGPPARNRRNGAILPRREARDRCAGGAVEGRRSRIRQGWYVRHRSTPHARRVPGWHSRRCGGWRSSLHWESRPRRRRAESRRWKRTVESGDSRRHLLRRALRDRSCVGETLLQELSKRGEIGRCPCGAGVGKGHSTYTKKSEDNPRMGNLGKGKGRLNYNSGNGGGNR